MKHPSDPAAIGVLDVLVRELGMLLANAGSSYGVSDALVDIRDAHRLVRADEAAHDEPPQDFFNFVIARGAAVFALYARELQLWVVPCPIEDEYEMISVFEPLAMVDVAETRARLADRYNRPVPDIVLTPTLATSVLA